MKKEKLKVRNVYSAIIGQYGDFDDSGTVFLTVKKNIETELEFIEIIDESYEKHYRIIDSESKMSSLIDSISEDYGVKNNILHQHIYRTKSSYIDIDVED